MIYPENVLRAGCITVRRLLVGLALLSPAFLYAQRPFTCEDQFFLTMSAEPPTLNEVIIDPISKATVFRSINANLSINVNAAGFRWTDNFIYCISPETRSLVRLDADGQAEVLAQLPLNPRYSYFAGDVTPDGRYLVVIGSATLSNGLILAGDLVRIDLEDPLYRTTTREINIAASIYDIAFHPITDVLYGYDSATQRLLRIDPMSGALSYAFPPSGLPFNTGSLFFDAYGNLFAYGSISSTTEQNRFYQINLSTGASRLLATGATAKASDGCSCPYTVELSKSVSPEQALPCTDVEYTFRVVNSSNRPHTGIRLEDRLPEGFSFVSVVSNPLGGIVRSNPGDAVFQLEDVRLPEGTFEVVIRVNTGPAKPGVYRNQARLFNLPVSLGQTRRSDDLSTLVLDDSTELTIVSLPFDNINTNVALCAGSTSLRLDAALYAVDVPFPLRFEWEGGQTAAAINVSEPGLYRARLIAGCDTAEVLYRVVFSTIDVEILTADAQKIALGDSLRLETSIRNTGAQTIFQWLDPQGASLSCADCPDPWARPFNDLTYSLQVQNELGCQDTASIRIFLSKNREVYFPNVFSPGASNESNAYFYGAGDPFAVLPKLAIYSRWGELMFEARNISFNDARAGWDGTIGGADAPPGVYVWTAVVDYLDGSRQEFAGDVTLLR